MPLAQPVAAPSAPAPARTAPAATGETGPLSAVNGNMLAPPATPAKAPSIAPRPHVFAYVAGVPPQTRSRSVVSMLVMARPIAPVMPALIRENQLGRRWPLERHGLMRWPLTA